VPVPMYESREVYGVGCSVRVRGFALV